MPPSTTGTPATPAGMSAKVLTMKFMQRAALTTSGPSTPSVSSTAGDTPNDAAHADAVRKAVRDMEERQQAAMERHVATTSDTHWVLPGAVEEKKSVGFVYVGYGVVDGDESDGEHDDDLATGRVKVGKWDEEIKKEEEEEDEEEESEPEPDHSPEPKSKRPKKIKTISGRHIFEESPRQISQAYRPPVVARQMAEAKRRREEKREAIRDPMARELRDKRIKKEVRPGQMNGNRVSKNVGAARAAIECHGCGEKGHRRAECPKEKGKASGSGPGRR